MQQLLLLLACLADERLAGTKLHMLPPAAAATAAATCLQLPLPLRRARRCCRVPISLINTTQNNPTRFEDEHRLHQPSDFSSQDKLVPAA